MFSRLCLFALTLLVLASLALTDAEAGRLGGGKSFGSKPSYSQSFSKPVPPAQAPTAVPGSPAAVGRPAGAGQTPGAAAPGSRWGGILGGAVGGLLLGGMLGSLFSGHGFGGMGGMPGLFDLLLIGGGIWLLMRFLRNRKASQEGQPAHAGAQVPSWSQAGPPPGEPGPAYSGYGSGPEAKDPARYSGQASGSGQTGGWNGLADTPAPETPAGPPVPPGFDVEDFVKGAKMVYSRLQESWDRRDLADIRRFTADEVYEEISRQAQADPKPGRTEVLLVNARLLEAVRLGNETVATVYYDVLLRENPAAAQPSQVREVWHFRRNESQPKPEWVLEGIQQLEN